MYSVLTQVFHASKELAQCIYRYLFSWRDNTHRDKNVKLTPRNYRKNSNISRKNTDVSKIIIVLYIKARVILSTLQEYILYSQQKESYFNKRNFSNKLKSLVFLHSRGYYKNLDQHLTSKKQEICFERMIQYFQFHHMNEV